MERIQAAIQKAKERRGEEVQPLPPPVGAAGLRPGARGAAAAPAGPGPAWAELAAFEPDARTMADNRIVTFADTDPAHSAFDMLRTKVLRAMRANGWRSLGITSPQSDCGKTTLAFNLAFSLAHQPDVRTVLVDLDMRRPMVARSLGLATPQSMASVLHGTRPIAENFVRVGDTLAIGSNAAPVRSSAEVLLNPATARGVAALKAAFLPDVLIYDLPPMLVSDDVMAFLPHLDCVLLVAAAEQTRLDEVDKCEQDLAETTRVLGVVLNKCRYSGEDYGYY
jgi:protein-tyrosine kinase